jgi:chromosome segregation ATPase
VLFRSQCEIQELQKVQSEEIDKLQQQFEDTFSNISKVSGQELNEQLSVINHEIESTLSQIELCNAEIAKLDLKFREEEEAPQPPEVENSVIADLRQILMVRNDERLKNLNESKIKLSDCVLALESAIHAHDIRVHEFHENLKSLDEKYEKEVSLIRQDEETKQGNLQKQLEKEESRLQELSKISRKIDKENRDQLEMTHHELDLMRQEKSVVHIFEEEEKDIAKLNRLRKKVKNLRFSLKNAEEQLTEMREGNERLKREIGRLKHEIGFAGRGPMRRWK